jgi:hypothetical protein
VRATTCSAGPRAGCCVVGTFGARFWRSAWDGVPSSDQARVRRPVLPGFTFNEGRHTQRTWLAEDEIPEAARAARLGHTVPGMGRVYGHVTPQLRRRVPSVLETRWRGSVAAAGTGTALRPGARARRALPWKQRKRAP